MLLERLKPFCRWHLKFRLWKKKVITCCITDADRWKEQPGGFASASHNFNHIYFFKNFRNQNTVLNIVLSKFIFIIFKKIFDFCNLIFF